MEINEVNLVYLSMHFPIEVRANKENGAVFLDALWPPLDDLAAQYRARWSSVIRHQFIALPEPLAAVECQRKGERAIKVVEDGGL
jgi:hypothetical protein